MEGKIIVDTSTVLPETSATISAQLKSKGARFVAGLISDF
jgi:3-hydroxyisobutyrate dehydrogenase-like beta-hydroxyacid dehydrogenase